MTDLDQYPIPVPNVVGRVLESDTPLQTEAVLVLPDKGKVKVLNELGARIWSLIDGKRSIREIASAICGEYEVELEEAEADTLQFMADLAGREVITLSAHPVRVERD
jgi:hypothetical protein